MSKNKGLKMQKRRRLTVRRFEGEGWYGQVYEIAPHRWAWAAGADLGDRSVFEGGQSYDTAEAAEAAMMVGVFEMTTEPTGFFALLPAM